MSTTFLSSASATRSLLKVRQQTARLGSLPLNTSASSISRAGSAASLTTASHIAHPDRPNDLRRPSVPRTAIATARRQNSSASTTPVAADADGELTWDRFFQLRTRRRYINLASSVGTSIATVLVAGPILAEQDVDTWAAQLSGMDPIIVLGLATFTAGGCGWLLGPTLGNNIFKMWAGKKGWNKSIIEKEKSFFDRIKRYRADPAMSTPQNPVPDYYGEKIKSVKDYRRWLKDQRAFNLKRNKNMI